MLGGPLASLFFSLVFGIILCKSGQSVNHSLATHSDIVVRFEL